MADTDPTIKLIVENGSGVENANSYVSADYVENYMMLRNYTIWTTQSEYVKRASIIKAMDYIDHLYNWKGVRKFRDQNLAFPRENIRDDEGFDVSGIIPVALKKAVCEAAFYVYNQYSLYAKKDPKGDLKKDKKSATTGTEIEKEYFSSKETKIDYTSIYESLDNFLRGLYIPKGEKSCCTFVNWRY